MAMGADEGRVMVPRDGRDVMMSVVQVLQGRVIVEGVSPTTTI